MFHSVTLKRSLLQISRANSTVGVSRSLSQTATYWEGSLEPSIKNSDDATTTSSTTSTSTTTTNANSSNGIIRFTMTPKPQHAASISRGYGTSNQQHNAQQEHYDACDNPFFDRTAAAEQMAKQMQDSYYYASYKAKSSSSSSSTSSAEDKPPQAQAQQY